MEKEFVNYNQALKLKALGFDEPCLASWSYTYELQNYVELNLGYIIDGSKNYTNAPTFSQAFRWFREKYDCHHTIKHNKKYVGIAYSSVVNFSIDEFETYEEAELACLDKLIEIVESKSE